MRPLFIQYGTALKYKKYMTIPYYNGQLATLDTAVLRSVDPGRSTAKYSKCSSVTLDHDLFFSPDFGIFL